VVEAGLLGLAQAARNVPLAGIALAALAAALGVLPPRWARPAGIAVLVLALGHAALGSHWFVDRMARDPLLARATEIPRGETSLRLVHEARFGREWSGVLVLAASGSGYALAAHGEDHPGFHLGGSGPARFVTGDELSFLGDGRMLVLTHQKSGAELRLVDAAAPETAVWQHTLPGVIASDLAAEPATGAWRLTAEGARDGYLTVVTGVAGQEAVSESRWPLPPGGRSALAVGTDSALAVTFDWRPPSDAWPAILPVVTMAVRYRTEMHLWLLDAARARRLAATRLSVRCVALPTATTPFACLAWDGARTHLWSVDAHGRRAPIGTLPGGGGRWPSASEDRIVLLQDGMAWLVDPGRRLAERLQLPGAPVQVVYRGGRVGAVSRDPDGVTLRLYALN
jgi:hypothetical protein